MNNLGLAAENRCVLLVDDDAAVRGAMRRTLVQAGLSVVEAECGDVASEMLEGAETFDLLVTDVRMPGQRDGMALACDWRRRMPGRPILFVSGYSREHFDAALLGSSEAVLHKPFQRALLLSTVLRLLDGGANSR